MQPNKDNFYFRHTKGDAVSERVVKMLNPGHEGFDGEFYGKINGSEDCSPFEPFFTNKNISIISATQAIRLMEGGEVWEPKVGEPCKYQEAKYQIYGLCGNYAWIKMDAYNTPFSVLVKEISQYTPAPPTAEQELRDELRIAIAAKLWGTEVREATEMADMILSVSMPIITAWHTKHQPIEVTDEALWVAYVSFAQEDIPHKEAVTKTVRWALARAKGGEK